MQTQLDKFTALQQLGFQTPYHGQVAAAGLADFYAEMTAMRDGLDYDIDGIVLSTNSLAQLTDLGLTTDGRQCPLGQIALKFPSQGSIVTIKAIEWSADGGAHLSPVAIFDPVELVGAVVQRASLKSYGWMLDHEARLAWARKEGRKPEDAGQAGTVGIGSLVEISRSGDVIPTISRVIANVAGDPQIPATCPCCGAPTARQGAYLDCTNPTCEGKSANQMRRFLTNLKVKGLGQDTLVEYANAGVTLLDFFQEDDFAAVEDKIRAAGTLSLNVWAKVKAQLVAAQS